MEGFSISIFVELIKIPYWNYQTNKTKRVAWSYKDWNITEEYVHSNTLIAKCKNEHFPRDHIENCETDWLGNDKINKKKMWLKNFI